MPVPTFAHQRTLGHILCTLECHAYHGGHSPCQALAEIPHPPSKTLSEVCCMGISDGPRDLLWTQTAGHSLHTDTDAPL